MTEPVLTPPHSLVDTFRHLPDARHTPQSEGKRTAPDSCDLPEQGKLVENIFFGDVSPKHAPYFYIRCISRCASMYSSRVPGVLPGLKNQHKARKRQGQKRDNFNRVDHDEDIQSSSDVCMATKRGHPSPPQQQAAKEREKLEEDISGKCNMTERQSLPLSGIRVRHEDPDDTACSTLIPLIVNTAGWTEGLGGQLLEAVGRLVRAAAVVRIVDEAKGEGTRDVMRNPMHDQNRSRDSRAVDTSSMLVPNKRIPEKDKLPQSTMMMHGKADEGMFVHPRVSQKTYSVGVVSFRPQGGGKEKEGTELETSRGDSSGEYDESLQQPVFSFNARDDRARQTQVGERVKEDTGREVSLSTSGEGTKEEQPAAAVNVPDKRALTEGRDETARQSGPHSPAPCPGRYERPLPHEAEGGSCISQTGSTGLKLQRDQKPAGGTKRSPYCVSVNEEVGGTAGTLQDCVASPEGLHGQPPITWSSESSDEDTEELVGRESHKKGRDKVFSEGVVNVECPDSAQRPVLSQAGETPGTTVTPASCARGVLQGSPRSSALLLRLFPLTCLLPTSSRSSDMARRRFASVFAAHLQDVGSKMFPSFFSHHVLLHSPFSPTDLKAGSTCSSASPDPLNQNLIDSTQLTPCLFRHCGVASRRRRTKAPPITETDATSDTSSDVSQYISSSMASDSEVCRTTAPQNRHVSCTNCGRKFVVTGGRNLAQCLTRESGGLSGETPSHSFHSVSRRTPSRNPEDDMDTAACNFKEESRQTPKHRGRVCLYRLMQSKEEPVPSSNALHA